VTRTLPEPHQLLAKRLTLQVGKRKLLRDVNLECGSGHWVQVMGANGVGKSTLLRLLAGITEADEGQVTLTIGGSTAPIRSHRLIYQGHLPGFKDPFTVAENLRWQLALDASGYELSSSFNTGVTGSIERVGLRNRANLSFGKLSAGQKRRCALARLAFSTQYLSLVKVCWILDEPMTALDTEGQEVLGSLLKGHLASGGSAILATHQDLTLLGLPAPLSLNLSILASKDTAAQAINE
jgi:heme exporter protein A